VERGDDRSCRHGRRGADVKASVTLQQIADAADRVDSSRSVLNGLIRDARAAGMPLRDIAKVANMSHEQVRRLAPRIDP